MSTPYKYTPLLDAQEIRLLTLLPGPFDSPIRITLTNTILTPPDNIPIFKALSYAWGSPSDPIDIYVGLSGFETLSVTHNLGEALPYLRYADRARVLWIDAICVNQQDLPERSQQVKRMADIYSQAIEVVVWLGLETISTQVAIQCFETIAEHIEVDWSSHTMESISDRGARLIDGEEKPWSSFTLQAMLDFLDYLWFGRLWIWQEVRLASSAILFCSYQSVLWKIIRTGVFFIYNTEMVSQESQQLLIRSQNLCDYGRYLPLHSLLANTSASQCTDPRDKIYALQSLLSAEEEHLSVEPDYTRSVADVYTNTTKRMISSTIGLQALISIDKRLENAHSLPSWVPDWSQTGKPLLEQLITSSASSKPAVSFPTSSTLRVTGKMVGTVTQAEPFYLESFSGKGFILDIRRIVSKFEPEIMSASNIVDLCRTLYCNKFSNHFVPPRTIYAADLSSAVSYLRRILESEEDSIVPSSKTLWDQASKMCFLRSLVRTADGYYGLAPRTSRQGDIVSIILGLDTAMILRPVGEVILHEYSVVGPAYCGSFTNGEALLGPLPEDLQILWQLNPDDGSYYRVFGDPKNPSVLKTEDPRLDGVPLPSGWIRHHDERTDDWMEFENTETGEETLDWDPRLTAEALRERGVELQDFTLV